MEGLREIEAEIRMSGESPGPSSGKHLRNQKGEDLCRVLGSAAMI
tara:strand:+ start:614 stop:748 length:135 start_codon:yes stop_codon:yes gene_type:complete